MAETKTIKIKNGETEIIIFGKGVKPLVILPGLSYDGFFDKAEDIERAYGVFSDEFTVYLIDRNLCPRPDYTVRDIADDVAEALNNLCVSKADVFGASLGGMVAQMLAIVYPELVDKLVLGSTLSRPNETFSNVLSRWEISARRNEIDELTSDINKTIYSASTLKKYASIFSETKTIATVEKTARFIAYINAAKSFDCYSSLDGIKSETLVIGATGDRVTTAKAAKETAKKLKCRYFGYKKYGHAVFDEAPDYKERLYAFLTK